MKDFRIAKCLIDGKIREYAIFNDGTKLKVLEDTERHTKFIEPHNWIRDDGSPLIYNFKGRIKDAYEMVKQGYADCIVVMSYITKVIKVRYYIDREIGEEFRQKTLDGWKDAKFVWAIDAGFKNVMNTTTLLNINTGRDTENSPVMTFDTKEEANEWITEIVEKSKQYAKRYHESMVERKEYEIIDEIDKETGCTDSIIKLFVIDMLPENYCLDDVEYEFHDVGYEIIQVLKEK